jgi:hypothetical protein
VEIREREREREREEEKEIGREKEMKETQRETEKTERKKKKQGWTDSGQSQPRLRGAAPSAGVAFPGMLAEAAGGHGVDCQVAEEAAWMHLRRFCDFFWREAVAAEAPAVAPQGQAGGRPGLGPVGPRGTGIHGLGIRV